MDRWREESRRPWLMDGDKGFMQQQHVSKEELQGNLQKAEEDMSKERTETPSFMFSRVLPSDQLKDRQKLRCLMSGQVEQLYRIFSTNKRRRWTSRRKMPFAAPKKPWQSSQPGLSGRTNPSTADTHTDMESRSNHTLQLSTRGGSQFWLCLNKQQSGFKDMQSHHARASSALQNDCIVQVGPQTVSHS